MDTGLQHQPARRNRRRLRRIENESGVERLEPKMIASKSHYEVVEKVRGIAPGGIGAIHTLARRIGLERDTDQDFHLLKRQPPDHASDHVLNIAYDLQADDSRPEHLEARRNDEVDLDALGAERIPDPIRAGDLRRRLGQGDVERLMDTFNETRMRVWGRQPEASDEGSPFRRA